MSLSREDIDAINTWILSDNSKIAIRRQSRKIKSTNIFNKLVISACRALGLTFSPTGVRAIATICFNKLKCYPKHVQRAYANMADEANEFFERNPRETIIQLSRSYSYRIVPFKMSDQESTRLHSELLNSPIPGTLQEAEAIIARRPLPTLQNPFINEDSADNTFATMLTKGSPSAFY